MQTGAVSAAETESTDYRAAKRWTKRVLLLVVILFIPYGIYVDLLPELEIRSGGSVVWSFYGRMSSNPEKGLFFFDRPFDVIATLILCIPGFLFLHVLDNRPVDEPVKRTALAMGVVTILIERLLAAGYVFLGGPVWMLMISPFSLTLPIIGFIVVPLIRRETERVSDRKDPHRNDPVRVGRTRGKELEPRRVGMAMFALALLAPQEVNSGFGFAGMIWNFGLTLSYDAEIWFYIYPFEWTLVLSLFYGLGLVFAHRVWLCSMGLAGEGTTVLVGILSQLVVVGLSILWSPLDGFFIALPFPLLFLTGLLIMFRCRQTVASSRTSSVVPSLEPRQES